MNEGYILGTVGTAEGWLPDGTKALDSKTLLNNSLSLSVSPTEVRGGENNGLIGTLFFDPTLSMALEDAVFKLEYLQIKTGSEIKIGTSDWYTEEFTVVTANTITPSKTPIEFGSFGKMFEYTIKGGDGTLYTGVFDDSNTATVVGLNSGDVICLKYNVNVVGREITISASFTPSEIYLLVRTPLFKAGSKDKSKSQKVGVAVIEIPRFLIDPSGDLSMSSNGVASVPLNGSAQTSYDNNIASGCDADTGFYGRIKEIIWDADIMDSVTNIVIPDAEIDLGVGGNEKVTVLGLTSSSPVELNPSELTYVVANTSIATVDSATGIVSAIATGSTTLEVRATNKPTLVASATITVS